MIHLNGREEIRRVKRKEEPSKTMPRFSEII